MKLEQTLEEIKLHNKSLTDYKFKVTRDYFELRLLQENQLTKELTAQKRYIEKYKSKLKTTKNISAEKIHKYTSKYKKVATKDNLIKLSLTTFDDIISEFDYNCIIHYENNREVIFEYIQEVFKSYIYIVSLKNKFKLELKKFNMSIPSVLLIQLVSEYGIFKRNLEVIEKLDYCIEDFRVLLEEQQTLKPIITEIFLNIVSKKSNNYIKNLEKENKKLNDTKTNSKIEKKIRIIKEENKKDTEEKIIKSILRVSVKSLSKDEEVIKLLQKSKESEKQAKERALRQANMTKEEKLIKKAKKKIGLAVFAEMMSKNTKRN